MGSSVSGDDTVGKWSSSADDVDSGTSPCTAKSMDTIRLLLCELDICIHSWMVVPRVSAHLRDYVKLLMGNAGVKVLPDMNAPVEERNGKALVAWSFKIPRAQATVEGMRRIFEEAKCTAYAVYTAEEQSGNLYVRGHAE